MAESARIRKPFVGISMMEGKSSAVCVFETKQERNLTSRDSESSQASEGRAGRRINESANMSGRPRRTKQRRLKSGHMIGGRAERVADEANSRMDPIVLR